MTNPTTVPANAVPFNDTGSVTSRNVAAPSDAATKTIYIWCVLDGNGGSIASSGFTLVVDNVPIPTASTTARAALLRKVEGGSPPASYTVTSASERMAGLCWAVSDDNGVDGAAVSDGSAASSATCPTVTPTEVACSAFLLVGTDNTSLAHGVVSGFTAVGSSQVASGGAVSVQYKTLSTTDATGDQSVSLSTSEQWVGVTLVIQGDGVVAGGDAGRLITAVPLKSKIGGALTS